MFENYTSQDKISSLQQYLDKYYTPNEVRKILLDLINLLLDDQVGLVDVQQLEYDTYSEITYVLSNGTSKTITVHKGDQGPKGDKGDKGDTGATGPLGLTGPKGDKGDVGPVGPQGERGEQGEKGATGDTGATGERGPQGIQGVLGVQGERGPLGPKGNQGVQGPKGDSFEIYKTYSSVDEMNADSLVVTGKLVLISSNVDDEDNAKLYVKTESGFLFLTDMSGALGIQGEQGPQGPLGELGILGPLGEQGIQGILGPKGDSYVLTDADKTSIAAKVDLSDKVDKETGKGLSTNDYTTNEKNKLAGIAEGAEVNVNADWNATSGDALILNKPTIPTTVSELTDSSNYYTKTEADNVATYTIDYNDVTVTKTATKGTAPYNTSYYYTNITVNTISVDKLVDGMKLIICCYSPLVVASSYRNVRIRFGTDGNWIPLYTTTAILSGSSYLTSGNSRLFVYRTDVISTGAFHMISDSNTTYSAMTDTEATTGTATTGRLITAAVLKALIEARSPLTTVPMIATFSDGTSTTYNVYVK